MMHVKYIYDVKSSSLYDSDGFFLKKVFCPKAKRWNQLIADDPLDRSRGCKDCGERVFNLDAPGQSFERNMHALPEPCVYIPANSTKVIFLQDINEVPPSDKPERNKRGAVIIKTARTIDDINRAANMGYWPDVRLVNYRDREVEEDFLSLIVKGESPITSPIQSKLSVGQNLKTGHIEVSGDFRSGFDDGTAPSIADIPTFLRRGDDDSMGEASGQFREVIPFTFYYPDYQAIPVAAYLIPPEFPDGGEVVVEDPIEDLIGQTWNQGDVSRAMGVKGYVKNRKIHLDYASVVRSDVVG